MSKIDKNGVYDLPIEVYHSDCTDGPSISSSGLRTIEDQSPAHYWCRSYLNPEHVEDEVKDHFSLGQAAHHLLLGESRFSDLFAIRPDEFDSWRTKASQEWKAAQEAAGKTVLTGDMLDQIRGMAKSLSQHPHAADLLRGEIEKSLIWKDKATGVWLKSRPDSIPADSSILADLKTTTDASAQGSRKSIMNFGYHMQLALCGMGMELVLGRQVTDYVLIFVETKPPYAVNVKPLDVSAIHYGRRQLRRAIDRFAECWASGHWPAYEDDDGVTAHLADWYRKRLDDDDELGLLPKLDIQGVAA